MQPVTEVPSIPPADIASPPPAGFVVVVWIGAFSAMVWMMFLLFGRRLGTPERPEPRSDRGESDVTLDEPGPGAPH